MAVKTYLQAISDGLREEMRRDERVFVIGEDVGVYGGAFKVTLGFQEEFGPWRVIDSPLSETAIVGGGGGGGGRGRRVLRRAVPLAEPRELVRAHPGPEDRLPVDAPGREGAARQRDRGPEPRPLLRA